MNVIAKNAIAVAVATVFGSVSAQTLFGSIYNSDQGSTLGSTLVTVNPTTGELVSTIGSIGYHINGLTYDPSTSVLYATTTNWDPTLSNALLVINPITGVGTPVGEGNDSYINVVTSNALGELYAWTESGDDLVRVNKADGTFTVVGDSNLSTYSQTLAFNKINGELFLINGGGLIYKVNTETGEVLEIGSVDAEINGNKLGDISPDSKFYVLNTADEAGSDTIYVLDSEGNLVAQYNTVAGLRTLAFGGSFGPSALDTLLSMQRNGMNLRKIFGLMASTVNPGLSQDCTLFDAKGICVSFTGKHTGVSGSSADMASGALTVAYKVNPNVRIGGYIEQRAGNITTTGIRVDNNNPDFGVFGAWSEKEGGEGLQFRAAYRYGKKNISITREVVGTSEAGVGESDLKTQGLQFTVGKAYKLNSNWLATPYVGVRKISIEREGYTEDDTVSSPLTYASLKQKSTQALLGVNFNGQVAPKVSLNGAIGLEHDMSHSTSDYTATGVTDLESFQFNDNVHKTRPVVAAGLTYSIDKTKQVSGQVVYRKEAFSSTATTTTMLTFTAGF